jgi:hypothetical protein
MYSKIHFLTKPTKFCLILPPLPHLPTLPTLKGFQEFLIMDRIEEGDSRKVRIVAIHFNSKRIYVKI